MKLFPLKNCNGIISIVCFIALIFISIIIAAPIVNDSVAKQTAKKLADLPLPEDTEFMEYVYKAGKLVGNGNGMQYFGAILIKSERSLEELKDFYSGFAKDDWECLVECQTDAEVKLLEHEKLTFETEVSGEGYFIVYSWAAILLFFMNWI